jgi:uncharacterized protein
MTTTTPAADFRPLPLLGNRHVQTLLGYFLKGPVLRHPARERRLTLPDGDRLLLLDSVPKSWRPGDPAALLLHGLGGCAQSSYLQRLAARLLAGGVRAVRLNMRAAGRGFGLARHFYHAGRTEDVRAALAEVGRWCPGSPLLLAGFSLGGNIALKLAGEAADEPVPGLARVAAVAPPIDLLRCAELLCTPGNRLYDRFFTRMLTAEVRRYLRFHGEPPLRFPKNLKMTDFDDLFTAPRCGFADARDYYRRSSAQPLIPRIRVPALILTARDDPFVAVAPFEELTLPSHVELVIAERGGHLGFLGRDGGGGVRWAERKVGDWLLNGR